MTWHLYVRLLYTPDICYTQSNCIRRRPAACENSLATCFPALL